MIISLLSFGRIWFISSSSKKSLFKFDEDLLFWEFVSFFFEFFEWGFLSGAEKISLISEIKDSSSFTFFMTLRLLVLTDGWGSFYGDYVYEKILKKIILTFSGFSEDSAFLFNVLFCIFNFIWQI